jgi:hypothetical protein
MFSFKDGSAMWDSIVIDSVKGVLWYKAKILVLAGSCMCACTNHTPSTHLGPCFCTYLRAPLVRSPPSCHVCDVYP